MVPLFDSDAAVAVEFVKWLRSITVVVPLCTVDGSVVPVLELAGFAFAAVIHRGK